MKTNQKKEYVSPQIDVILVELEEGIAQTSGVANAPEAQIDTWTGGQGGSQNQDAF